MSLKSRRKIFNRIEAEIAGAKEYKTSIVNLIESELDKVKSFNKKVKVALVVSHFAIFTIGAILGSL